MKAFLFNFLTSIKKKRPWNYAARDVVMLKARR
jgi:hypothetical protein